MIIPTKIYDGVSGGAVDLSANGSVHALDITGKIPAGSTITEIRYYVSGGDGASVTFQELCLVASQKQGDTSLTENTKTNFSLPGYTVLIVEHMGGDGTLFYVDAVIGGEEYSDESIHQLKAKMMDGFILYVPDSAWENGVKASRGDIVTAGWANNAYVFLYDNVTPTYAGSRLFDNNGHYSIKFYENPTEDGVVKQFTSDATTSIGDVNATVQMFNYDKNINQSGNPLQFWNGYWGYAAEVESEDGSGIEDDTYRYPYVKTTLGEDGYPAFHPYVVDPNGAYYKTSGSQFLLAEKADVYKNVDFSKTFDANGAENGKGTYYKDSSGNLVPVADAGKYAQVDFSTKYSVDTTQDISLGYLFGAGVDGSKYGAAQSNGVTAYAPMNNGGGLFRHDPHTGNYFYYSMQNAAYFDPDANGGKGGFTLYDSLIVRPWYNSVGGDDYDRNVDNFNYDAYIKAGYTAGATVADPESYGNFLPFNKVTENNITLDGAVYTYDAGGNRVVSTTDYSATVQAAAIGGTLEKYGLSTAAAQKVLAANKSMGSGAVDIIQKDYQYSTGLHTARLEDDVDMWFGMTVDFNFFQPYGGQTKTATGEINDMVFDFEGDDDVFVYVGLWDDAAQAYDYRLVLDIGGIHEARKGLINFASGAVEYKNCYGENVKTTLGEIFDLDKDTFEDFSRLSLKFFYMERGGNISCCCLRFNLPTLPEDSLTVSKALDTAVLGSQSYQFRVLEAKYDALSGTVVATDKPVITAESLIGTSNDGFVDENGTLLLPPVKV